MLFLFFCFCFCIFTLVRGFVQGLDAVDAPFLSADDVAKEFQMAAAAGVQELDIWFYQGPGVIKEPWWSLMAAFRAGSTTFRAQVSSVSERVA